MPGQFYGIETIKPLVKTGNTQLKLPSGSVVKVGGLCFISSSDLFLNLSSLSVNSLYFVYLRYVAGAFELSASMSVPSVMGGEYKIVGAFYSNSSSIVGSLLDVRTVPTTEDISYSPSILGMGTITDVDLKWRRIGTRMELSGAFNSGSPTSEVFKLPLPTGYHANINTNSLVGRSTWGKMGASGADNSIVLSVLLSDTTNVVATNEGDGTNLNNFIPMLGSFSTSNFRHGIMCSFPITGWTNTPLKDL